MSDFEDRIEKIAEEIKETSVAASRAEDSGDTIEAGKKYKQIGVLADQGLKLLVEHEASRSRIDDWRKYKQEHNEHGTKLLKNGESDVEPDPFRLDVLTPNFAVIVKDGDSEPETFKGAVDPSTGEPELDENPAWEPNVSVAGLGPTGAKTVEMIETGTSAQIYTSPRPNDVADSDFLFISCDFREPGVEKQAFDLLETAGDDTCTVLFSEGPTENLKDLIDHTNLFFPVAVAEGDPRWFLSATIADLFEAMLRPTLRELGKGDILSVTGENRLGRLFIDDLADTSELGNLTPGFEDETVDAKLLFVCYDGPYPAPDVERTIREYDRPDDAAYLWDPRTHSRYQGRAHIKRIEVSDTDRETMVRLLRGGRDSTER
ncbi:hypothetical protein [Halosimplex pelagicum]|uniref:Uncharacterized protein n=1 Tax=Halosimplex pelagicum TaxID=869886 RepID=A0A7D5TDJ2_9EURY|nr:hypothetical protein [Halosimplex pelagicum]QLH83829.1 hypothetical protein HZS54_20305 [Halosimplex pelagicum]